MLHDSANALQTHGERAAHQRQENDRQPVDAQSLVWFGIGGGAALFAGSLLHQRYIKKTPRAVESRGSFTMFAILMLMFSIGAIVAGLASL
jgi:hypothetical protein